MELKEIPEWDAWNMGIADRVAARSKDQSTQLGAVIVGPNNEPRSWGYNSFPRGILDNIPERHISPEKYLWVEHAERNAIYNAALHGASLQGCTLYCPWPPCIECARGIIQVGIIRVVVKSFNIPERWRVNMSKSITMLKEAGVRIKRVGDALDTHWDDIQFE
jgi:dCMP deaminase